MGFADEVEETTFRQFKAPTLFQVKLWEYDGFRLRSSWWQEVEVILGRPFGECPDGGVTLFRHPSLDLPPSWEVTIFQAQPPPEAGSEH